MQQKLTISFEETQKSVNATMKLEVDGGDNDQVILESKRIFEEIQKYSKVKTLQKTIQ